MNCSFCLFFSFDVCVTEFIYLFVINPKSEENIETMAVKKSIKMLWENQINFIVSALMTLAHTLGRGIWSVWFLFYCDCNVLIWFFRSFVFFCIILSFICLLSICFSHCAMCVLFFFLSVAVVIFYVWEIVITIIVKIIIKNNFMTPSRTRHRLVTFKHMDFFLDDSLTRSVMMMMMIYARTHTVNHTRNEWMKKTESLFIFWLFTVRWNFMISNQLCTHLIRWIKLIDDSIFQNTLDVSHEFFFFKFSRKKYFFLFNFQKWGIIRWDSLIFIQLDVQSLIFNRRRLNFRFFVRAKKSNSKCVWSSS